MTEEQKINIFLALLIGILIGHLLTYHDPKYRSHPDSDRWLVRVRTLQKDKPTLKANPPSVSCGGTVQGQTCVVEEIY